MTLSNISKQELEIILGSLHDAVADNKHKVSKLLQQGKYEADQIMVLHDKIKLSITEVKE